MAVYTNVTSEDLAAFLEEYDVGHALSFKGIAEGVENSNFLLKTSTASFILTLYERRVDAKDLPFFLGLMGHVAGRDVTCPLPVKGKDGELFRMLNGRPAALITFLEGVSIHHPGVEQCRALGTSLAEFHVAASNFKLTRANSLGQSDWAGLFDRCRQFADEIEPGCENLIASELDKLSAMWPLHLPKGIVHADLFPDNVFFLGNRLSGIIDFYFACNDMLAYDLAVCINAWCFDDDFNFQSDHARAIISAYSKIRPFSELELDALPLLCRGAAVRFFLTRLYDWSHREAGALVQPKNPIDFLQRLKFHQSISGPQAYGL